MGQGFLDKYSQYHFLSGVVANYAGLDIVTWFIVHGLFEAGENTEWGMRFINDNFPWWPGGGKTEADATVNIWGDQLSAIAGWWAGTQIFKGATRRGPFS